MGTTNYPGGLAVGSQGTVLSQIPTATIAAGAEAANVRRVTVQLKDENGANVAAKTAVEIWLAISQANVNVAAVPDGGFAVGTKGTIVKELVADQLALCVTDATGALEVDITESTAKSFFVAVKLPNGTIVVSTAIAFV